MDQEFDYDYFVIGGGSGGIASAKAAQKYGAKVAVADFVKPSPVGTKWGLGGTCVNVGCIPKKMMHLSAGWGEYQEMQRNAGWQIPENTSHEWDELVGRVQMHIKKLNWGYKTDLSKAGIEYYNALGKIVKPNTIELTKKDGSTQTVTSKYITIAVGGRPTFLDGIQDIEKNVITSDDIFQLSGNPGKVLIVGASYIALECAGFLHSFGHDVTVMVRSIFLRGFDQECANKIANYMEDAGIKFIQNAVPSDIKVVDGKRKVTFIDSKTKEERGTRDFDTVMLAVGRSADTKNIGLENVGIKTEKNGKLICSDDDSTGVKGIYAIGDCVSGRLELTPTAIMAGKLLSARLFNNAKRMMSYKMVATTVFTPLEYGCIGYAEEEALQKYGDDRIKVYQALFKPLEWNFSDLREEDYGFIKLICDKKREERVIGFHYLGPHAGEVTQGFSVAINIGANYEDFITTVGIHPTQAEEVVKVIQVKGEGELEKGSC